jgi:hypothetical protein
MVVISRIFALTEDRPIRSSHHVTLTLTLGLALTLTPHQGLIMQKYASDSPLQRSIEWRFFEPGFSYGVSLRNCRRYHH